MELKARVAGLAAQLNETATLITYVPTWVRQCDQILYPRVDSSAVDKIQRQMEQLTMLISESRFDYFSGAIFKTKYDFLPGVSEAMDKFRNLLDDVQESQSKVRWDVELPALQKDWSIVEIRLHDLRNEADKIRICANELHGRLIEELRQASIV
ncbi:hypothetical protein WM15_32385 [Burkholderia ubonensis]|nr:hypothetical protein WM15_32385 [Burkholderia ubonensis]